MLSIKQVLLPPKSKRSTDSFVRTPFHMSCPARYSVLHLSGELSGGNKPRQIVKPFFMSIYDLSIFLTSTAFVDTKATFLSHKFIYGNTNQIRNIGE